MVDGVELIAQQKIVDVAARRMAGAADEEDVVEIVARQK
jgi:hypothetical protein